MPDESEICLAALFLNKGKAVLTEKEFSMYVSLDLRWMSAKDANSLINVFLKKGLLKKTGDYLKPSIDLSAIDVPVAYRPSEALIASLKDSAPVPDRTKKNADLLSVLIDKAVELNLDKGTFVSECNKISKRINADIEVAALIVLNEQGADISPFIEDVRSVITSR